MWETDGRMKSHHEGSFFTLLANQSSKLNKKQLVGTKQNWERKGKEKGDKMTSLTLM